MVFVLLQFSLAGFDSGMGLWLLQDDNSQYGAIV
jgi:hypothetical protein